jgi:tRNA(Ile)-lysidine synthase
MCIRTRRPGDYFVTDADGRHQLLKKYMIDQKISRDRRADMLLIAEGSHILWMPGGRISEDVRVSRSMKKVLEITVVKHEEMRKENAE